MSPVFKATVTAEEVKLPAGKMEITIINANKVLSNCFENLFISNNLLLKILYSC